MADYTSERTFQDEIVSHLTQNGWLVSNGEGYDQETALYTEDVIGFVQETQPDAWEKLCKHYPQDPEKALIRAVTNQLSKADPRATSNEMRKYGTLGVMRHPIKDRGAKISLCQFKPDHDLNPDANQRYGANRLRVIPEVVYSPHSKLDYSNPEAKRAKKWRIDLVLFVNGIPVVTMELKSEFKQDAHNAIKQYKYDRLPIDPATKKPEPLLTFKRGALVHFAVSQYEVQMCTKLAGANSYFLPFNKGTVDGGAGNSAPEDGSHPTSYLWEEVLQVDNFLNILGRYVHLEVKEDIDHEGRKSKKETLIFPRYHQWDVVRKLLSSTVEEGCGQKYLIQHSAGSGKSNSIAWSAHQLSALTKEDGDKLFSSVIVITDRTVLDDQLQNTISQFEHKEGVVGRINREEGTGSKSEQLAAALMDGQAIIIVTIQTFPFILEEIRKQTSLKARNFAIIADEAHSSQSGSTARKLKEVLMVEHQDEEEELTADELLDLALEARKGSDNLSYYAFTATPKPKTLELFGQVPNPALPPSDDNKPEAFHVYTMRQAIEEGFILDVLRNYTTYSTAFQLAAQAEKDREVDSQKASKKLRTWITLHPHNVGQRVQVIVEHFRDSVQHLLGGQAKAMVVTSSRIEAARYKLAFDKYIRENSYSGLEAMVAFSGEVNDPESSDLPLTEKNMNLGLKGRDMRTAFDTPEYQIMIVANKFQTGFDQPKLCAMYVLKKLKGVDCVQTLSRLNRTFPGKKETGTFVLDFVNDPEDIQEAFQPYYQVAELDSVSDPNQIYNLYDKLTSRGIFMWGEVEDFTKAFFSNRNGDKANKTLSNACSPAAERWRNQYREALESISREQEIFERVKATGDAVLMANSENTLKEAKDAKDQLDIFKKDLGSFTRFYEFMSQIVDYSDSDLEKLNLYARHLVVLLRSEAIEDPDVNLSDVELTHYRLQKRREQNLALVAEDAAPLTPGTDLGSGKSRDKEQELLSNIIQRMNDIFAAEELSDGDVINFANTIADKVRANESTMSQIRQNSAEQAMLGDFPTAVEDAVLNSGEATSDLVSQFFTDPRAKEQFTRLILQVLLDKAS